MSSMGIRLKVPSALVSFALLLFRRALALEQVFLEILSVDRLELALMLANQNQRFVHSFQDVGV